MLEDPAEDTWLCNTPDGQPTSCCPVLINPVTGNKTCSCSDQESPNVGYIITPDCQKRDVDECASSLYTNGDCHPNAVCENLDGLLEEGTHNCWCPPGMVGDGVYQCDVYVFTIIFKVAKDGTLKHSFNTNAFLSSLWDLNVIPVSVNNAWVNVTLEDYASPTVARIYSPSNIAARSLLNTEPTGTLITVNITVPTKDIMYSIVGDINVAALLTDPTYSIVEEPYTQVVTIDSAFGAVSTTLAGFTVDSVIFSQQNYNWIIDARYIHDVPNTITGLYVSRVHQLGGPYPQSVRDSFYVSQHPCMRSTSVCCLLGFRDSYIVGMLGDNITNVLGTCNTSVQQEHTLGMFNTQLDNTFVDNVFEDFADSSIHRITPGHIQLLIGQDDLLRNISIKEDLTTQQAANIQPGTGYKLTFFVGMSYFTLLPANAISTVSSQTQITVMVTNSLIFSFSSQQDYTFVKYITLGLYQNKWVESLVVERYMQFVKVGVVLPTGLQQNMKTGLVPLSSIRFAVATTLPNQDNEELWTNPCYSSDNTGMWDITQPWRSIYAASSAQGCATQHNMCTNPITALLSSNLVEFYFPIGDATIGSTHFTSSSRYYIFVYFDISVTNSIGHVTTTKVFAQAPINELSVARSCETLQTSVSMLDTTKVDLAIGLVGNEPDWQSSMHIFNDIAQTPSELLDTAQTVHSLSIQSGLITLVVQGEPAIFTSSLASRYYIDIEHLSTIHFLDPVKYETVKAMIDADEAYTIVDNGEGNGRLQIRLSQNLIDVCTGGNGGLFSCAVRHDISSNTIQNSYAVHSFATGIGTTDQDASRDWITNNLLGVSEFSEELAANMTALVRSKYSIDDRVNKAWYVNPGYSWTALPGSSAQEILQMSDKLIAIAVITLNDGNGNLVRRRLLTASSSSSMAGSKTSARRKSKRAIGTPGSRMKDLNQVLTDAVIRRRSISTPTSVEEKFKEAMNRIAEAPR